MVDPKITIDRSISMELLNDMNENLDFISVMTFSNQNILKWFRITIQIGKILALVGHMCHEQLYQFP